MLTRARKAGKGTGSLCEISGCESDLGLSSAKQIKRKLMGVYIYIHTQKKQKFKSKRNYIFLPHKNSADAILMS